MKFQKSKIQSWNIISKLKKFILLIQKSKQNILTFVNIWVSNIFSLAQSTLSGK